MPEKKIISWSKKGSISRSYSFQLSPKIHGTIKRKGIWSPDGSAEIGDRKLRFRSNGKANMNLVIYDSATQNQLGQLDFYWKDFQRSKLVLSDGAEYTFRSFDLLRGVWSWVKKDSPIEQYIFRVDSPFQRSGSIESEGKELPALERDILLLLGLNLQHYINNWLMTIVIVVIAVVTGH